MRPTMCAPDPRKNTETMVVGVNAILSTLGGLKFVPAKWCCLVLGERRDNAQSRLPVPRREHAGHNASG